MQQAQRNRLVLVAASTFLVVAFIFLARGALFPFILSGTFTYLLYPVVRGLERVMPWRGRRHCRDLRGGHRSGGRGHRPHRTANVQGGH